MIQYLSSVYSPFRGVRLYILYTKQLTFMFTLKTTAWYIYVVIWKVTNVATLFR